MLSLEEELELLSHQDLYEIAILLDLDVLISDSRKTLIDMILNSGTSILDVEEAIDDIAFPF